MFADCTHKGCVGRRSCRIGRRSLRARPFCGHSLCRDWADGLCHYERNLLLASLRRLDRSIALKESRIRSLAAQLGLQLS